MGLISPFTFFVLCVIYVNCYTNVNVSEVPMWKKLEAASQHRAIHKEQYVHGATQSVNKLEIGNEYTHILGDAVDFDEQGRIIVLGKEFMLLTQPDLVAQIRIARVNFTQDELSEYLCSKSSVKIQNELKKLPLRQTCDLGTRISRLHPRLFYCRRAGDITFVPGNVSLVIANNVMFLTNRTDANCFQKLFERESLHAVYERIMVKSKIYIEMIRNISFEAIYTKVIMSSEYLYSKLQSMNVYNFALLCGVTMTVIQFILGMGASAQLALLVLTGYTCWDLTYWMYATSDNVHVVIQILSVSCIFFAIIMYFCLMQQFKSLHEKSLVVLGHVKNNYTWGQNVGVNIGMLVFKIIGNVAIAYFAQKLILIKFINTVNIIYDWQLWIEWFIYMAIWACIFLSVAISLLMGIFGFVFFLDSYRQYAIGILKSCLYLTVSALCVFIGLNLLHYDENVTVFIWVVHMLYHFVCTWTLFVVVNWVFTHLISYFISTVIFDCKVDDKNKYNFIFTFVMEVHYLYYIDIIKRIVKYNFLMPMFIFVLINFTTFLFLSLLGVCACMFLSVLLFVYAKEGFDQVTCTKNGLQQKCYNVSVMIRGIRPQILNKINEGYAAIYLKYLNEMKKMKYDTEDSALRWREQIKKDILALQISVQNELFRARTSVDVTNANAANQFVRTLTDIVARQMAQRVEYIMQNLNAARDVTLETNMPEDPEALARLFQQDFDPAHYRDDAAIGRLVDYIANIPIEEIRIGDLAMPDSRIFPREQLELYRPEFLTSLPEAYATAERLLDTGIWATSPEEACLQMQMKNRSKIPLDCSFQGEFSTSYNDSVKGSWVVTRVDEPIETFIYKGLKGFGSIIAVLADWVIVAFVMPIFSLFAFWKSSLVDEKVALTDSLVNLLHSNVVFETYEYKDYRDLVFNQNANITADIDPNFCNLIRQLSFGANQNLLKQDLAVAYKRIFKARNKSKDFNNNGFKLNLIPLFDVIVSSGCFELPKKPPSGYQFVFFSGIPYMVPSRFASKHCDKLGIMYPFTNKKICIDYGGCTNFYSIGHIYNDSCISCCRLPMTGQAEYGYGVGGITNFAIAANISKTGFNSNITQMGTNMLPTSLHLSGIYGVLNNGTVVGNANAIKYKGKVMLATAAHNVAMRGDGQILGPRFWSEHPIEKIDNMALQRYINQWGPVEQVIPNYYSPKKIEVESVKGDRHHAKVVLIEKEIALLEFLDPVECDCFSTLSEYLAVTPDHLFLIEQIGVKHVPRYVPVVQYKSNGSMYYDYRTGAGYSGAALLKGDMLVGIHLGGFGSGQATSFARLIISGNDVQCRMVGITNCDHCGGIHCGDCDIESGQQLDDDLINKASFSPFDGKKRRVVITRAGDNVVVREFRPGNMQSTIKTYTVDQFLNKGLDEIADTTIETEYQLKRDLNTLDDALLSSDELYDINEIASKISNLNSIPRKSFTSFVSRVDTERSQINPIPADKYTKLAEEIGENVLVDLLNKSLNELKVIHDSVTDSIVQFKEQKNKLEMMRDQIYQSYDYKRLMEDHKREMQEYLLYKKEAEEFNESMREKKKQIKGMRDDLQQKCKSELTELKNKRKEVSQDIEKKILSFKKRGQSILALITESEKELKTIKKEGMGKEGQELKKKISDLESKISQLGLERKTLSERFSKNLESASSFVNAIKTKLEKLRQDYLEIKDQQKQFTKQLAEENLKFVSQEKSVREKYMDKMPEPIKSDMKIATKPKLPTTPALVTISEELRKLKGLLKMNNLLNNVFTELIKCETDHQRISHLNKLSSKENVDNQLYHEIIGKYDEVFHYFDVVKYHLDEGIYSKRMLDSMKQVCTALLTRTSTEILRKIENDVQEGTLCSDCVPMFMTIFNEVISEFLVSYGILFDEPLDVEIPNSQSLSPVYLHIVPSMTNTAAFRSAVFSSTQPAILNCSNCCESFQCNQSHVEERTGNISDLGCTLECLFELSQKMLRHKAECMNKKDTHLSFNHRGEGVSMHCVHPSGRVTQILTCPEHCDSPTSCYNQRQMPNSISFVVENQVRYIDIACFVRIIYRMASCQGECKRPLNEIEKKKIMASIGVSTGNSVRIGDKFVSLQNFEPMVATIMTVLMNQYGTEIFRAPQETNHQFTDTNQALSDLTQRVAELSSIVASLAQREPAKQTVEPSTDIVMIERADLDVLIKNVKVNYDQVPDVNQRANNLICAVIDKLARELNIDVESLPQKRSRKTSTGMVPEKAVNSNQIVSVTNEGKKEIDQPQNIDLNWVEVLEVVDLYSVKKFTFSEQVQSQISDCFVDQILDSDCLEASQASLNDVIKSEIGKQLAQKLKTNGLKKKQKQPGFLEQKLVRERREKYQRKN